MPEDQSHIPNVAPEIAIRFGEIDLQIEEVIRSFDDDFLEDLDAQDRAIILLYLRWAYYQGYEDGSQRVLLPSPD